MNTPSQHKPPARRRRQGASIIIVIAFYAVAMTLFGVWIHTSLGHMRQTRRLQEKRQAVWLADSGLRRAVALLANDPNYTGEEWQLAATEIGGQHTALVKIQIAAVEKNIGSENASMTDAEQVLITAIALFPADTERQVRHTKSITITPTASTLPTKTN